MIDVIGMGAQGWASLGEPGRSLVREAEVVLGGRRHLGLLPGDSTQQRMLWPSPLRDGLATVLGGLAGRRVVALASGDPLVSGVGTMLVDLLGADHVRIHPAVSSLALTRARMGWSAESAQWVSLVGRSVERCLRYVHDGARLIVLSSDRGTPGDLATLLAEHGYGASRLTVFGDLGAESESRQVATAREMSALPVPALNTVAVQCVAEVVGAGRSLAAGLPDDAYEHDGQLTKRDARACALAQLAPLPGQLLWDVGAGAGSVGIEWSRVHPRCRAIAIEGDRTRAARIERNAGRLGVPELRTVCGYAPGALLDLPRPDAVFVGGGASAETLDLCWEALAAGGRIVAHAVTIETELLLVAAHQTRGGTLTRISVETVEPLGRYFAWAPSRPVVQWSATKAASTREDQ